MRLEGGEPRFPVEVASFRKMFNNAPESRAPWYAHWPPGDWTRDFHGAVRLYINADNPEFVKQVEFGDPLTLQVILADIMGQIIERLVQEDEVDELLEGVEPGSLGAQAKLWINTAWPNKPVSIAKSTLENRPGYFRATMLMLAELPEEQL